MRQTIKVADKPTADGIKATVENNAAKIDSITKFLESGGVSSNPEYGLEAIKTGINEIKKSVSDGKKKAAGAIAAKGIQTAADASFDTLAENIGKIVTLSSGSADANATAAQILSGYSAYVKGAKVNGSMPNHGAISQSLGVNGSYTIPAGYHNGNGKVTQSLTTQGAQTITPGTSAKYVEAGRYLSGRQTIAGDANLAAANIKKGVSIFGVAGNYGGEAKAGNLSIDFSYGSYSNYIRLKSQTVSLGFTPSILLVYSSVADVIAGILYIKGRSKRGFQYSYGTGYSIANNDNLNGLTVNGSSFIISGSECCYIAVPSSATLENRIAGYIAIP